MEDENNFLFKNTKSKAKKLIIVNSSDEESNNDTKIRINKKIQKQQNLISQKLDNSQINQIAKDIFEIDYNNLNESENCLSLNNKLCNQENKNEAKYMNNIIKVNEERKALMEKSKQSVNIYHKIDVKKYTTKNYLDYKEKEKELYLLLTQNLDDNNIFEVNVDKKESADAEKIEKIKSKKYESNKNDKPISSNKVDSNESNNIKTRVNNNIEKINDYKEVENKRNLTLQRYLERKRLKENS
jgi:hypothetical protein